MSDQGSIRRNRLKKLLLDKKREMWATLRDDLFRKLGKEYSSQFATPHDIEELALIDVIEDTGLAVADIQRRELEQMDRALKSLEDGTYGECRVCGADIDEERLKAVPFTDLCVKCKEGEEAKGKKPTL